MNTITDIPRDNVRATQQTNGRDLRVHRRSGQRPTRGRSGLRSRRISKPLSRRGEARRKSTRDCESGAGVVLAGGGEICAISLPSSNTSSDSPLATRARAACRLRSRVGRAIAFTARMPTPQMGSRQFLLRFLPRGLFRPPLTQDHEPNRVGTIRPLTGHSHHQPKTDHETLPDRSQTPRQPVCRRRQ